MKNVKKKKGFRGIFRKKNDDQVWGMGTMEQGSDQTTGNGSSTRSDDLGASSTRSAGVRSPQRNKIVGTLRSHSDPVFGVPQPYQSPAPPILNRKSAPREEAKEIMSTNNGYHKTADRRETEDLDDIVYAKPKPKILNSVNHSGDSRSGPTEDSIYPKLLPSTSFDASTMKSELSSNSSRRMREEKSSRNLPIEKTDKNGRLRSYSRGEYDGGEYSLQPNARTKSPLRKVESNTRALKPMIGRVGNGPSPMSTPLVRQSSLSKGLSVSKHYALSNQILSAFDSLYQQKEYRGAYAFGIRYAEVALIEIPKHGYFYAKRHAGERIMNSQNALRVTRQIKYILTVLDSTPSDSERQLIEKLNKLAEEQVASQEQEKEIYERERQEVELDMANKNPGSLYCDLLEYVEMICPPDETSPTVGKRSSLNTSSSSSSILSSSHGMERPRGIQRHSSLHSQQSMKSETLQRALLLSGGVTPSPSTEPLHSNRKRRGSSELSIKIIQTCYHDDFAGLRNQGQLRVSQATTHQGKNPGSANGCSLIAPLLCYHHFINFEDSTVDQGLHDGIISEVIDVITPELLPQVRSDLGLYKDALIIPSDVHSFLIEKGMLTSEQFVTVCGGDILSEKHLTAFTDQLQQLNEGTNSKYHGRKLAATFFFHEHVVSILKLQRNTEFWYDVIDSLPNQKTLKKEFNDIDDAYFIPNTSRIRCMNIKSLQATLKWYACSRFTDENMTYIDRYDWDESYSDFDPRVFQAFIWAGMN